MTSQCKTRKTGPKFQFLSTLSLHIAFLSRHLKIFARWINALLSREVVFDCLLQLLKILIPFSLAKCAIFAHLQSHLNLEFPTHFCLLKNFFFFYPSLIFLFFVFPLFLSFLFLWCLRAYFCTLLFAYPEVDCPSFLFWLSFLSSPISFCAWDADFPELHQQVFMPSGFWLCSTNRRHQEEIRGWKESDTPAILEIPL